MVSQIINYYKTSEYTFEKFNKEKNSLAEISKPSVFPEKTKRYDDFQKNDDLSPEDRKRRWSSDSGDDDYENSEDFKQDNQFKKSVADIGDKIIANDDKSIKDKSNFVNNKPHAAYQKDQLLNEKEQLLQQGILATQKKSSSAGQNFMRQIYNNQLGNKNERGAALLLQESFATGFGASNNQQQQQQAPQIHENNYKKDFDKNVQYGLTQSGILMKRKPEDFNKSNNQYGVQPKILKKEDIVMNSHSSSIHNNSYHQYQNHHNNSYYNNSHNHTTNSLNHNSELRRTNFYQHNLNQPNLQQQRKHRDKRKFGVTQNIKKPQLRGLIDSKKPQHGNRKISTNDQTNVLPDNLKEFLIYDKKEEGIRVQWDQFNNFYYNLDEFFKCDELELTNQIPIEKLIKKNDTNSNLQKFTNENGGRHNSSQSKQVYCSALEDAGEDAEGPKFDSSNFFDRDNTNQIINSILDNYDNEDGEQDDGENGQRCFSFLKDRNLLTILFIKRNNALSDPKERQKGFQVSYIPRVKNGYLNNTDFCEKVFFSKIFLLKTIHRRMSKLSHIQTIASFFTNRPGVSSHS